MSFGVLEESVVPLASSKTVKDIFPKTSTNDKSQDFSTPLKTFCKVSDDLSFSPIKLSFEQIDYESRRLERIQENQKALQSLGISSLTSHVRKPISENRQCRAVKRKHFIPLREKRHSSRLKKKGRVRYFLDGRATKEANVPNEFNNRANLKTKSNVNTQRETEEDIEEEVLLEDRLYTCAEYFTFKNIKPKLVQQNGHFSGWVEKSLLNRLGIEKDMKSAWENNGGGKFSFSDPTGLGGKRASAKDFARTMLKKNPNCYFYRHTAPDCDHWQGDWTEPENEKFLEVAIKYGVGNKWGLFATYIPHRVGYQCSNHYRSHFIEGGIIWDDNFRINKYGGSVYIGNTK